MTKLIFCNKDQREKNGYVPPHRHSCNEVVLYGDSARGETEINGKRYEFRPGEVAVIRSGIWHSERHEAAADVIFLGFEASAPVSQGVWPVMQQAKPLFYDIVDEVRNQEWGYEQIISGKLQEILTLIGRRIHGMAGNAKSLTYCKRYMEENYMQNIRVAELANMTCYSPDRFRHLFTEEFGVSPQSHLISVRLSQAKRLLESTRISCMDIAQLCGFSDSGQMTKMVKKRYGRTPRELRAAAVFSGQKMQ